MDEYSPRNYDIAVLKYLISFVDEYIDETYALFGQMEVSFNDVEEWKKMASLVSSMLTSEGHLVH